MSSYLECKFCGTRGPNLASQDPFILGPASVGAHWQCSCGAAASPFDPAEETAGEPSPARVEGLCRDVLQAEPAECEVRVSEVTMQPRSKRIVWVKRR